MNLKKMLFLALAAMMVLVSCIGCAEKAEEGKYPIFTIELEAGGIIKGELYPDVAPESVGNFIELANSGFYDGVVFHRIIPDFVIQGGDPTGTGMGGPEWRIKGEFSANGVKNDVSHLPGVLSMARSQAMDSGGSQFFIVHGDASFLDGQYAAFGMVTEGMEFVDRIVNGKANGDQAVNPEVMKTVTVETFGVEYPFTKIK